MEHSSEAQRVIFMGEKYSVGWFEGSTQKCLPWYENTCSTRVREVATSKWAAASPTPYHPTTAVLDLGIGFLDDLVADRISTFL
jgi:hypothetical protein